MAIDHLCSHLRFDVTFELSCFSLVEKATVMVMSRSLLGSGIYLEKIFESRIRSSHAEGMVT